MLLMRQGENAWLLTSDGGAHEYSKIRYFGARYMLRDPSPRLGPFELEHVALDKDGAHLSWSGGRKSWLPASWYQATWTV